MKNPPPLPLPHSFGPGTFALHSHYNPLFEKILDPPLEGYLSWIKIWFQHSFILMYCYRKVLKNLEQIHWPDG